jgi:hypothetical protein
LIFLFLATSAFAQQQPDPVALQRLLQAQRTLTITMTDALVAAQAKIQELTEELQKLKDAKELPK